MHRDARLYLDDILEAVGRVAEYLDGYDYERFMDDRKTQDAVVRNLEIIGEAANRLHQAACRRVKTIISLDLYSGYPGNRL